MNLSLDPSVALGLTSRSQIARRVTERWAAENLFCLACPSDELTAELTAERANAPVQDFTCPRCKAAYQLKGKNGRHGNVVANSAFDQKIAAIREGESSQLRLYGLRPGRLEGYETFRGSGTFHN